MEKLRLMSQFFKLSDPQVSFVIREYTGNAAVNLQAGDRKSRL
jgi:hypothetical protein